MKPRYFYVFLVLACLFIAGGPVLPRREVVNGVKTRAVKEIPANRSVVRSRGAGNLIRNATSAAKVGRVVVAGGVTSAGRPSGFVVNVPRTNDAVLHEWFATWGKHKIHPTRILAKPRDLASVPAAWLAQMNLMVTHQYAHTSGLVLLDSADGQTPQIETEEVAAARGEDQMKRIKVLRESGLFEYVEPDWIVHTCVEPTDASFTDGTLWALKNTGISNGVAGVDLGISDGRATSNAWDVTTGSTNVIVAVIDTGARYTHRDLAANMWRNPGEITGNGIDDDADGYVDDVFGINAILGTGNPFDDNDHGTHVSGTIGAEANNGQPHVGVAWQVRIMACKFLGAGGSGATSDAIKCIEFAVSKKARILSNSWGGGGFSQALYDAILVAQSKGALFVAAAGNGSLNTDVDPSYPASYDLDNIVTVAAFDRSGRLANFSNYGARSVDVGAPGVDIFSCSSGSDTDYKTLSGTSMACPHVSGVAALLLANDPNISLIEMRQRLITTAIPTAELSNRCVSGGRVSAFRALTVVADGVMEVKVTPSTGLPLPGGASVVLSVAVTDLAIITNATVTAVGDANVNFLNNGIAPDNVADDYIYTASVMVPANTNAFTLTFIVTAPGKTNYTNTVVFPVQVPPPNDDFENRTLLSGSSFVTTGSNVGASRQVGEPNHGNVLGGRSVWWSWTAPTNASFALNTVGSPFDTILAVYVGSTHSNLVLIASDDDSGGSGDSALTINAVAGVTYQIAVDGYGGTSGDIFLTLTQCPNNPPTIAKQPANVTAILGGDVAFSVDVAGGYPLTAQWLHDGLVIPGATNLIFRISPALPTDAGNYQVIVTNGLGRVTSTNAVLTVTDVGSGFLDDFDPTYRPTNWSGFGEVVRAAKYGGSVSGINSLWFSGDGVRFARTRALDFSFGGFVSFSIRLADGQSYPWENVDLDMGESVVFEYSTNGITWTTLREYDSNRFKTWTFDQFAIPAAAQGTNTFLRWRQLTHSGPEYDQWAIDDVLVEAPVRPVPPRIIVQPTNQNASVDGQVLLDLSVGGTGPLSYQWLKDGAVISNATNEVLNLVNVSSNDAGGYSVLVSNLVGSVLSSNAVVSILPRIGEALGLPLAWVTGGSANWNTTTNVTHDGIAAVQSGTIMHNQESWLETTVVGPGTLTFWWKVSSEFCAPPSAPCDTLNFILSGTNLALIQGEVDWEKRTFSIGPGMQTLRWSYIKDPAVTEGADRGWLDEVIFTPTGEVLSFALNPAARPRNGTVALGLSGQIGRSYTLQSSTNLVDWTFLQNILVTNSIMFFPQSFETNASQKYYRVVTPR